MPVPGSADDDSRDISVEDLFLKNIEDSFPGYFNYYYYFGSDSAPPC